MGNRREPVETYEVKLEQIDGFAKELVQKLHGGEVLCLVGDLGSGKTTFTKKIGHLLGVREMITSPSFVTMNVYNIQNEHILAKYLYHIDFYRDSSEGMLKSLDIENLFNNPEIIFIIEWADLVRNYLPKKSIWIEFN